MLTIKVNVNKLLMYIYGIGVFFLLTILAGMVIPLVLYQEGFIIALVTAVLFAFAYLAYLAGLVKESRDKGVI